MARTSAPGIQPTEVQNSVYTYAEDAQVSDSYAITLSPSPSGYVTGQMFLFKANTANTGASSLNVNGLGAKTIKKHKGEDLADNDIKEDSVVSVVYDGTNFQMISMLSNAPAGSGDMTKVVYDTDDDGKVNEAEAVEGTGVKSTGEAGGTKFLREDGDGTCSWQPATASVADGDKGDITVSVSGATWTIDNGAVTLAKQADMATASLVYRKTAGAGAPEVQSLATLKTDLGLTGTNSGDQTLPTRDSLGLDTDDSPQFAGIELGHASDTTITRTGAGAIAVEGTAVLLSGGALGTPASGTLTNCSGLPLSGVTDSTSEALGVGTLELGHASDTTIARVSAGVASIEGNNIITANITASDTVAGVVELATDAEMTTGTATNRAITPANAKVELDKKLALAGGTMTGNVTLGENASVDLDPSLSADGKYTGMCITGTAGATLAFGDLVYLQASDSRWELADADAVGTSGTVMLGLCVLAANADGDATKILLHGNIRADTAFPALTIGAPAYVSTTAGDIQVSAPTGADDVVRVVGFALTADALYFCPSPDHITHVGA